MNCYSMRIGTTKCTTTCGTKSTTKWTPMTTLTTGRHSTSTIAWRFTTCTSTNSSTERAHVVCSLTSPHYIGSSSSLARTSITTIIMAIQWLLFLDLTSLFTSSPSSCLSSSFPSSTSATSSSRSSTRRSWKTCATPLPTGVRAPTTSSTSPQTSRRQSIWKSWTPKNTIDFFEGDCMPTWSTNVFVSWVPTNLFGNLWPHEHPSRRRRCSRIWCKMGRSSLIHEGSSHGCHTRKYVQNKTQRFGENTLHSSLLFLHTSSLVEFKQMFVKTYTFVLGAQYFRSLLCACAAQTSLILCDRRCVTVSRIAAAVLGKKSRCVSTPHSPTAHLAHSVFGGYRRHTLFTSCEPTYHPMTRRNLLMRSGQATPIPQGNHESVIYASWICSQEATQCSCIWTTKIWKHFFRMESQELSIRRIMSEEVARSELAQMERDARYALYGQHHEFQFAVRQYQRHAIDAVSQAVHALSECYEAMMMQEFQGIQDRCEGRMEENERRVAQVIGSEAREGLRVQRNHMLQEQQVLVQNGRKKSCWNARCTRSCVKRSWFSKSLTWKRNTTRAYFPKFPKHGTQGGDTKSPVRIWRTHDDVHDRVFKKHRKLEASWNQRLRAGGCSSKWNVEGIGSVWFLENTK